MGWNHLDSKFLYVTDGGHFENLGLVELLRRGCTMIYCFDAAGDDVKTFDTLGEAVALARAELSVEIEINPDPLRPVGSDGYSSTDFVVGSFRYRNKSEGLITFAKATITEDAPWDVRAFARKDKRFPTHGTVDQFFNEQKFEAYRALGAHTARRALAFWDRPGATPSPAQSSKPSVPTQGANSPPAASSTGPQVASKGHFRRWRDRRRAHRN
jgi:hypothetical protein